jgi:undecaprenyl-diphosphatase
MQLLEMVILAIVQGIAEFLPISSSGHLVVVGALLGETSESAAVEIILHTGTLASILVIYWRRILMLLTSDRRVLPLLVVGTLPAAVIGLSIKIYAESLLKNPLLAGCMLLVTATLLWTLRRLPHGETEYPQFRWWQALAVGCFQAIAILPGISRSGATIFAGRLLGLRSADAVTFSFLLAIPAISGATVLAVKDLREDGVSGDDLMLLIVGSVIAFVVGIFALRWLIRWSRKEQLHWFAYWCAPVGVLVIALHYCGLLS